MKKLLTVLATFIVFLLGINLGVAITRQTNNVNLFVRVTVVQNDPKNKASHTPPSSISGFIPLGTAGMAQNGSQTPHRSSGGPSQTQSQHQDAPQPSGLQKIINGLADRLESTGLPL